MIPTLNSVTAGSGLALPEYVSLAARHGFSGVEFSIDNAAQLVAQTSFADVAAIFESHKVLPIVMNLPVDWRGDENTFETGLANLPLLARLAQDLDCTRCVTPVFPDAGIRAAEYASQSTRRLVEIARVLADNGLRLGLEFLGPKHFRTNPDNVWFYDIAGALQAVESISRTARLENLGLLVDSWHWYTSGGTAMDLASIPIEQIVAVHINDAPDLPRDAQIDNARLLPGQSGIIDIQAFLQTLAAIGYDGPLGVETFSAELNSLAPDQAAARAAASVTQVLNNAGIEPVRLL